MRIKRLLTIAFYIAFTALAVHSFWPMPWPSVAMMPAQSGTIPKEWTRRKVSEYREMGCTHVGVTRLNEDYVNVWCVIVYQWPDE